MAAHKATSKPNNSSSPLSRIVPSPPPPPLVPATLDDSAFTNGKRKKKKKGKSRGSPQGDHETLSASFSVTSSQRSGPPSANLGAAATNITPSADLIATAHDIYRRFESSDPSSLPDGGFASFRSMVQNYTSSTTSPNGQTHTTTQLQGVGGPGSLAATLKDQAVLAITQQMMASGKTGVMKGSLNVTLPGSYPSSTMHFDGSMLADVAHNVTIEQFINSQLPQSLPTSAHGATGNVIFGVEPPQLDDEYYSEDEVDDNVDGAGGGRGAEFTLSFDAYATPASPPNQAQPQMDGKRLAKASKKKKKKVQPIPPPPAPQPPPPAPAPISRTTRPPPPTQTPPVPTPPPNPTPKPSSRAAGKQPMYNLPPSSMPNGTTGTRPSARAASKAPALNYPPQSQGHAHGHGHHHPSPPSSNASKSRIAQPSTSTPSNPNPAKIWSTNSTEERERIKEFWLGLGEKERKELVRVEKETVLRKMKEQQRHSCSCAVCGRKRTAIEEELEVLYDAYYEELEQYAMAQQKFLSSGGTIPPPPGPGPFPGSVELDKNGAVVGPGVGAGRQHAPKTSVNGKTPGAYPNGADDDGYDDEEDEDDGYDDEDDDADEDEEEDGDDEDEDDDDDDPDDDDAVERDRVEANNHPPGVGVKAARLRKGAVNPGQLTKSGANGPVGGKGGKQDYFSFGSGLAVAGPGNILTVADDLLKNDGQKFLEMMETLAERRMLREDDIADDSEDDEDDDEEAEEEDDDGDDDDDDEEEALTEEQKMEEGKRMFSIFAARMFEQRVLQAYREKVAQERQLQLLRELEDEDRLEKEREAKKQNANQKKKDKKKQQKAAKEEEKAKKDAEKAAEEAALKAKLDAVEEQQRKRKEEERLRREAERLKKEEERLKLAEEKRKKLAEEQRKQAEKLAAEQKRAAEKAAREKERKEKEEKDRKAKEEAAREERERKAKEDEARKEKEQEAAAKKAQELAAQRQAAAKVAPPKSTPVSPRPVPVASGSSQRGPTTPSAPAPKKILSKPPQASTSTPRPATTPAPIAVPVAPRAQQAQRPAVVTQSLQANLSPNAHPPLSATTAVSPHPIGQLQPPSAPSAIPVSAFPPSSPLSAISMQSSPYPPPPGYGPIGSYGNPSPQLGQPGLAPSALPRGFPGSIPGSSNDFPFEQAMGFQKPVSAVPSPIGPPPKGIPSPQIPPASAPSMAALNLAFGNRPDGSPQSTGASHIRRPSAQEPMRSATVPSFGAVQRPIAPISRPSGFSSQASADSDENHASGSTSRRTPSPDLGPVLGSSALLGDDDELILPASGRRVGAGATVGWGTEPSKGMTEPPPTRGFGPAVGWPVGMQAFAPSRPQPNNLWAAPFPPQQTVYGLPSHFPPHTTPPPHGS